MERTTEFMTLTAAEVAAVAGVPRRHVDHVVDKHIVPDAVRVKGDGRRFWPFAASLIAIDYELSKSLTLDARREAYDSLFVVSAYEGMQSMSSFICSEMKKRDFTRFLCTMKTKWICINSSLIEETQNDVYGRYRDLLEANRIVVIDPHILSGTPVIRGTRIPVYDVAASVDAGISSEEIEASYDGLTAHSIELASIWAKANPPIGRPRRALGRQVGVHKIVQRKRVPNASAD